MSLDDIESLAREIHFNSVVVDCHNDTMLKVIDSKGGDPVLDIGGETELAIDINKAEKGGLNLGYFAAFTDLRESESQANDRILSLINALYYSQENNPDRMELVTSLEEINQVLKENKLAGLATIEGAYSISKKNGLELLRQYYDLGIRVVAYVWNQENNLGAGTEGPEDMGLTDLGIEITREMNRLGILIDVSHMNEKTFWDCIEYSEAPIIASHSCSRALTNHVRNLTDQQILAIKDKGGIVNVNYWWELLGRPKKTVNISSLVDHIDHIVNLVGVDYVGLGSDFDGASMPEDLKTVEDLPKISLELVKRGYTREDIEKILGLNNLRVMKKVQDMAEYRLDNNLEINVDFKMGESIGLENIRAEVPKSLLEARIFIDGLEYETSLMGEEMRLVDRIELYIGYHVVSFEVVDDKHRKTRKTLIFKYE